MQTIWAKIGLTSGVYELASFTFSGSKLPQHMVWYFSIKSLMWPFCQERGSLFFFWGEA